MSYNIRVKIVSMHCDKKRKKKTLPSIGFEPARSIVAAHMATKHRLMWLS